MFSWLRRNLFGSASEPVAERRRDPALDSLHELVRRQRAEPTPDLPEENETKPPAQPEIPVKHYQFKGLSCFIHPEDNPGMNGAGGFASHRSDAAGRHIIALTPCMEMEDDCRTLRDQHLRPNIVGTRAFRKGNFPHQAGGPVYWVFWECGPNVSYHYFWEQRAGLTLHLSGDGPRQTLPSWEPLIRFAAASMRGDGYVVPILTRGLALERQDDGAVAFYFSDPDPQEPLRPQCFVLSREQFAEWLETCTSQPFSLQQGSNSMSSRPAGGGVEFETSDRHGPHLGGALSAGELQMARSFLG
ncbi:MAG: hypothetical protein KF760_22685 [Candidatus Eremiobacteraeota bacterium]|nr:hypothetical protein [Candidatus Eremiobacteraeota bacterium]MCW5868560.1 hypothetical protein [Candidatus Eremiobacteraeota bacterium]